MKQQNGNILLKAHDLVNGDRQAAYGSPKESFAVTAKLWTEYMGREFKPKDVAMFLALVKIARESYSHSRENLIDACGYLAIAADLADEE